MGTSDLFQRLVGESFKIFDQGFLGKLGQSVSARPWRVGENDSEEFSPVKKYFTSYSEAAENDGKLCHKQTRPSTSKPKKHWGIYPPF